MLLKRKIEELEEGINELEDVINQLDVRIDELYSERQPTLDVDYDLRLKKLSTHVKNLQASFNNVLDEVKAYRAVWQVNQAKMTCIERELKIKADHYNKLYQFVLQITPESLSTIKDLQEICAKHERLYDIMKTKLNNIDSLTARFQSLLGFDKKE